MIQYILIAILFLIVTYLFFKKQKLIIKEREEIIFKEKGKPDYVIKKINGKLITGFKSGNTIIEKSTI